MKRITFLKVVELYHAKLVNNLVHRSVAEDLAQDIVQDTVASLLENKAYTEFEGEETGSKSYSYLKAAVKHKLWHAMRAKESEASVFVPIEHLTEQERKEKGDVRTKEKYPLECPYCHDGELFEHIYKGKNFCTSCPECHTVLGRGKSVRQTVSIEEDDIFEWPNLDLRLDVQKALAQLTPLERRVVEDIVYEHDTLEGLADSNGMGRATLCRIYVEAKKKLQNSLLEYS
jgi:RNA polymerase sigma factor (sigma-70 family)